MKRKWLKPVSMFMLTIFLNQLMFPTVSYALTGGPTQPEVHGFEPVNSNQMVDLFTGDFTYSVPLMDVGGYPINLAYHAGAKMDQEASMVGLGWSLTPGAINRTIRGIPDDFKGDEIQTQQNIRPNETWGIGVTFAVELIGIDLPEKLFNASFGNEMYYNNYKGFGTKFKAGVGFDFRAFNERITSGVNYGSFVNGNLSLSLTSDSKNGVSLEPNLSLTHLKNERDAILMNMGSSKNLESMDQTAISGSIGMSFSSGRGLSGLSYSAGITGAHKKNEFDDKEITTKSQKRTSGASLGGGTSIGYSAYLPSQPQNMFNFNAGRNFSTDAALFGADAQVQFNGYYSKQWMRPGDQNASSAAYGALYNSRVASKVEKEDENAHKLLDFNRTTDYAYQHGSTNLQLSQTTHDMYSIAGQGTGGSFRLHTNDIPVYGDPINYNRSLSYPNFNVGIEGGTAVKFGLNVGLSSHYSHSGSWLESWGNEFSENNGQDIKGQDAFFQQRYFMKSGEMTPVDQAILDYDQGIAPSQPVIDFRNNFREYKLRSAFRTLGVEKSINTADRASGRLYERRAHNAAIDHLTNAEAKLYGLNRSIFSYGELLTETQYQTDEADVYERASINDVTQTNVRQDHHIGAFKVVEPNGTKYIYDLPAYNFTAYEVAFNVDAKGASNSYEYYKKYNETGLIEYDDQDDASVENENGESHFFQKRSVPAHAHAHLLTGILSPDYVDVQNDGITEDDLGTAVKFNYSLHSSEYGWRSPYEKGKARFNEVFRSVDDDDKASYSYGTKELWYVHSIESKTHIAEFYYSDREDALGVSDERGTKGNTSDQKMSKLDRIELYNKVDRFTNKEDATPIKVVHFGYTYELCKGVPNHVNSATNKGKLTLKKLSFSYGKSQKAMMSPYVFEYDGLNPDYDPLAYDSWGGYKENDLDFSSNYFPYAEQDKTTANTNASAWNLTQINLPSGGQMNIEYESDDYAYVMEHDAHLMFKLKGISDNENFNSIKNGVKDVLYDEDGDHMYLFFDLESSGGDDESIEERYMPRNRQLFYKFSTFIKDRNEPEFTSGFVEIEGMGIDDDNSTIGWMKIKPHELDNGEEVHPISFDAWNFFLQSLNEKVFDHDEVPSSEGGDDFMSKGINNVLGHMENIIGFAAGKYQQMERRKYAAQIDLQHCVMRLKAPYGRKMGGGHRVKRLTMTDNWNDVTTADYQDGVYGTVYSYREDGSSDINTISAGSPSTGVASYETAYGTEENPYRLPISFDIHKFPRTNGIPDFMQSQLKEENKWLAQFLTNEAEIMGPVGEAFFPNPSVGYSKVTVKSLATAIGDGAPTGSSVHQFYTTRSHPIRIEQTPIDPHYRKTNPLIAFLSGTSWTRVAASQGYSVITNDMNGRPFSTESFDHKGDLISGAKYLYQTRDNKTEVKNGTAVAVNLNSDLSLRSIEDYNKLQLDYASSENNWLDNEVRVLDRYGNLKDRIIGMEYDISVDTRASRSISWQGSFDPNLDIPVIFGIPIPLPMLMFGSRYDKSKFNSATATKIIQQHAILKSVVAFDEQSIVRTENVLWDEETGNVLLTKTYNEYNDAISNFSYPAQYAYKNLGSTVKNQGVKIKRKRWNRINFKDGLGVIASANDYFTEGDVLATSWIDFGIRQVTGSPPRTDTIWETYKMKAWVKEVKGNKLFLIDREGAPLSGNVTRLEVMESGYKNILGGSVAGFTTMEEVDVNQSNFQIPGQVTQTSAATFSDHWQTYADEVIVEKCKLDTGIAYILQEALNDGASGTFFDSLDSGNDGALYHMSRAEGFNGSKLADLLHEHTGYPKEISGTCIISSYWDTLFAYQVTLGNGRQAEVRFTGSRPPGSAFSGYESWYIKSTFPISRVLKDDCVFDTAYADYLGYDASKKAIGSFHFTLGKLQESLDDNYCEFVLHDSTFNSMLRLSDISGFSNIRLNKFIDDGRHFYIDATTPSGTVVLQGSTNCFHMSECWKECKRTEGDTINPYVIGIRGIWRGQDNYAYHGNREITTASGEYTDATMIRHDGEFSYNPLWEFDTQNGGLNFDSTVMGNWISPATLTKVSPAGNHVESVDALGRPSTEIYGYQRKMVTGVAQNAGHHEIGFDGFEDYDYPFYEGCRKEAHWALQEHRFDLVAKAVTLSNSPLIQSVSLDDLSIFLSKDTAHTGRASLRVPKNNFVTTTNVFFNSDTATYDRSKMEVYKLGRGEIIQNFALEKGEKYIISAWVREGGDASRALTQYSNSYLRVKINGLAQSEDFYPDGPIIEGWQRVFAEFTIPDTVLASSISIEAVVGNVQGAEAYFDDIRIQPYNSAMVSYVYDPVTLRLTAELDENNFATFYEYDQEGRLLRIKKETERGIVTLQESRYGIPKK